ncbi:LPS assembly lipoprotein LptE [Martelella endophytica]|uniref:LPS assembly lipoprotein LptE n=1 Tax=Martelella endophytica TaxID=1486262 RepID=UPI001FCD4C13|nr:LPS assembly lipoprotein LptE [Martelella endophytica]
MSDRLFRAALPAAALAAVLALSSCQVRPLYGGVQGAALNAKMHELAFNTPSTPVAQAVLNELIFLTGGGKGESLDPKYDVSVTAYAVTTDVLVNDSSDTADAGRTIVTADFSVRRRSDSKLLASGQRRATALVDFPSQEFAKQRAIRDAERRAAREVAEIINADIAIALNTEPPEELPPAPGTDKPLK